VPDEISGGQRARLLHQAATTRGRRVAPATLKQYTGRVGKFHAFCDRMGFSRSFKYKQITCFYQWYVAGIDGGAKLRAHTTIAQYATAFWDYALDYGTHYPGVRTRRRITKFVHGLQNRYPHVPILEHPLLIKELVRIAGLIGIRSIADLESCSVANLVFWARILTAHNATMRAVGHCLGMQLRDVEWRDGGAFLTIGRRDKERKEKHRMRTVPLPNDDCFWCSGFVLRVLKRRVHGASSGTVCLFPNVAPNDVVLRTVQPWAVMRARLERLARRIGINGRIGGRSLRAGGTTDWFSVQATRQWVKHQGGWKSNAFERYDRPTPAGRQRLTDMYTARLGSMLSPL
jgi:hypothetical protein